MESGLIETRGGILDTFYNTTTSPECIRPLSYFFLPSFSWHPVLVRVIGRRGERLVPLAGSRIAGRDQRGDDADKKKEEEEGRGKREGREGIICGM